MAALASDRQLSRIWRQARVRSLRSPDRDARTAFRPMPHPMARDPHISSGRKDREPISIWTFRWAFPRRGGAFLDRWLIGRCRVVVLLLSARCSLEPG